MRYRPEIDGLRAVAVLPVVFFHAGLPGLSGGYVGVDVFFVISGYLITSLIVLEQRRGDFSIGRFYERRARRILPALFLVMLACLPLAWAWMLPLDMKAFCASLVAVASFASNILFFLTTDYFDTASEVKPLLHTWSLAVEEQFYVVFPLLVVGLMRWGRARLAPLLSLLALASLGAAQWYSTYDAPFAYFLLPTRAWELIAGALAALWLIRQEDAGPADRPGVAAPKAFETVAPIASMLGLAAIVGAVFWVTPQTPDPSVCTLLPVGGAVAVVCFASERNLAGRLLASRLLVAIGLISYGIYVWHQPLLAMARLRSTDPIPSAGLLLGAAALSLPLAWLTWRFVERPMRDRRRVGRRSLVLAALGCSVAFVAFGVTGFRTHGFPMRVPTAAIEAIGQGQGQYVGLRDDAACNVEHADERLMRCIKGDPAAVPGIALIGDSQAASLAHALGAAVRPIGRSLLQYTKIACFPQVEYEHYDFNCRHYIESATADARSRPIETFVFYSIWQRPAGPGSEPFDLEANSVFQTYRRSISELVASGHRVVVVYPTPEPGHDLPTLIAKKRFFGVPIDAGDDIDTARFRASSRPVYRALDALGQADNLIRVYPEQIFCDTYRAGRCVTTLGGQVLFSDYRHLSEAGQAMLAERIVQAAFGVPPARSRQASNR